jgi:hypothetical protein
MRAATLFQQVDHVFEILDVTALIAGNRNALRIFLQGSGDDFFDRAVMAQMNYFGTIRHQDAAHDVDRGIMAVEQRSSRDETDFVSRFIFGQILGYGQVSHVFLNKVWQRFALWAADFLC